MLVHAFLAVEVPCARRTRCSSTLRARRANHSPQGVETGDLRSSRHMSQVNSDMLSVNAVPSALSGGIFAHVCKPLVSVLVRISEEMNESLRPSGRRDRVAVTCTGLNSSSARTHLIIHFFSRVDITHSGQGGEMTRYQDEKAR